MENFHSTPLETLKASKELMEATKSWLDQLKKGLFFDAETLMEDFEELLSQARLELVPPESINIIELDEGEMRIRALPSALMEARMWLDEAGQEQVFLSIKALMDQGMSASWTDSNQNTLLHEVMRITSTDSQAFAEFLLEAGVDVNAKTIEGETALHIAAAGGNADRVRWLLEHEASPYVLHKELNTPLSYSLKNKQIESAMLLLSVPNPFENQQQAERYFRLACGQCSKTEVVQKFLDLGVNINAQCPDTGNGALHKAIVNRRDSIVIHLLEAGINTNLIKKDGEHVFHTIVMHEHDIVATKMMQKVLQHSEKYIDHQTPQGLTPLHISANRGMVRTTELLIRCGADVNALNKAGQTPLEYARLSNNNNTEDVVNFLQPLMLALKERETLSAMMQEVSGAAESEQDFSEQSGSSAISSQETKPRRL